MSFFVYVTFFFQFRITQFFCNGLFCNIGKPIWLIFYLDLLSLLICLYALLIILIIICLPTLRLSISIKHLCLFFHWLPILMDILKFWPPSPPFIKFNKDLWPPVYFDSPFIRHLRVKKNIFFKSKTEMFLKTFIF